MFITVGAKPLAGQFRKGGWVRVEASKNRLIWVRPRKVEVFSSRWREIIHRFVGPIEQIDDVLLRKPLDSEKWSCRENDIMGPMHLKNTGRVYRKVPGHGKRRPP